MITIKIKNYRCFADTNPLTVDFDQGFTALLGSNNSGKTSLLKFIFEFQTLWQNLSNPAFLLEATNKNMPIPSPRSIVESKDIECDFTKRPMEIEFSLAPSAKMVQPHLEKITVCFNDTDLGFLRIKLKFNPPNTLFEFKNKGFVSSNNENINIDNFTSVFRSFANCMYAPAFRNAINEGASQSYGFSIGTGLVSLWDNMKAGTEKDKKNKILQITDDIKRIFGWNTLEINATNDKTTLDVIINGRPYRLNDLGAGLSQFIILFANIGAIQPALLLIDEPEIHLHPSLQLDFLTSLASYTATNSIIFATHSIGLARTVSDKIYSFQMSPEGAIVKPFEDTPMYAQFLGELSFSSYKELGFDKLLLVEGPSEIKSVQQFLRKLDKDHKIVLLPLGGNSMICGNRAQELAEIKRITNNIAVMIDSEKIKEDSPLDKNRADFLKDCSSLDFKTKSTDLRAFENYFTERAIKRTFGDNFKQLTPYQSLNEINPNWNKKENWKIAREMSKEEILATDIGKFLNEL